MMRYNNGNQIHRFAVFIIGGVVFQSLLDGHPPAEQRLGLLLCWAALTGWFLGFRRCWKYARWVFFFVAGIATHIYCTLRHRPLPQWMQEPVSEPLPVQAVAVTSSATATVGSATGAATTGPANYGFKILGPSSCKTFADIGGMSAVKAELRSKMGVLIERKADARALKIAPGGFLFWGEAGNGKTLLAEACAGEYNLSYLRVTAGDLLAGFVGGSEQNIRRVFAAARAAAPCILCIDEIDAVGGRRDGNTGVSESARSLLTELLRQVDEAHDQPDLIVVACTNDLAHLDGALIRAGRLDTHIGITNPDFEARVAILAAHLRGRPVADGLDLDDVAAATDGLTGAALRGVIDTAAGLALERSTGSAATITQATLTDAIASGRGKDRPTAEPFGFDDLVLPDDTVKQLRRIVKMLGDPDGLRRAGLKMPTGCVMSGPPGTGKSSIARALAGEAQGVSFISVRGSDLVSAQMGASSQAMADLFKRARSSAPCIVFLDEAEAVLGTRQSGTDVSGEKAALVGEFLSQLDGLGSKGGIFVMAATNLPEQLDRAVTRSGRLSQSIYVGLPDEAARLKLWGLYARGKRLAADVDLGILATTTDGWSPADIATGINEAAFTAYDDDREEVAMSDFAHVVRAHRPAA